MNRQILAWLCCIAQPYGQAMHACAQHVALLALRHVQHLHIIGHISIHTISKGL